MNCTQSQNMLDDYIDGNLSAIQLSALEAHLKQCDACTDHFNAAQKLLVALKDIPVPPAHDGYEKRMLKFLEEKKPISKHSSWFVAGFTSAIAASFAFWLIFSPVTTLNTNKINSVNLIVQKKQTVDLVFNLDNALAEATLTLELPEKVEIAGYPGKRELSWKTSLKKGANRLALPLIATEKHTGYLIAHLKNNGKTKTFRIHLDTKQPQSSLLIQENLQVNT